MGQRTAFLVTIGIVLVLSLGNYLSGCRFLPWQEPDSEEQTLANTSFQRLSVDAGIAEFSLEYPTTFRVAANESAEEFGLVYVRLVPVDHDDRSGTNELTIAVYTPPAEVESAAAAVDDEIEYLRFRYPRGCADCPVLEERLTSGPVFPTHDLFVASFGTDSEHVIFHTPSLVWKLSAVVSFSDELPLWQRATERRTFAYLHHLVNTLTVAEPTQPAASIKQHFSSMSGVSANEEPFTIQYPSVYELRVSETVETHTSLELSGLLGRAIRPVPESNNLGEIIPVGITLDTYMPNRAYSDAQAQIDSIVDSRIRAVTYGPKPERSTVQVAGILATQITWRPTSALQSEQLVREVYFASRGIVWRFRLAADPRAALMAERDFDGILDSLDMTP